MSHLHRRRVMAVLALAAACAVLPGCGPEPPLGHPSAEPRHPSAEVTGWRALQPGLELGRFPASGDEAPVHVVRVDPERFGLRLLSASARAGGRPLTAREWAQQHELVATINAGMYQEDLRTGVSMTRSADHVNNPHLTGHQSVLAFDRRDPHAPRVYLVDRECESFEEWRPRYEGFVQSIRMLSCTGDNVWSPETRPTSTAAIGIDGAGRLLLVHVRATYTTHDAIDRLIALPLDLRRLMYAEGGHEAQLYVRGHDEEHEFVGRFGAGLDDRADNARAWPIPNVLGVVPRGGRDGPGATDGP